MKFVYNLKPYVRIFRILKNLKINIDYILK